MEAAVDLKYLRVFPNGGVPAAAKRTRLAALAPGVYRECLKNHAATLGGHALDGCGEFMPSPEADPADPTSLRCAACGCHRNFHRRVHELPPSPPLIALPPPPPPPPMQPPAALPAAPHVMRGEETPDDRLPAAYDDDTEESDEGSDFDEDRPLSPLPPVMGMGPPGYRPAEPHMLVAPTMPAAVAPRPPAPTIPAAPGAAAAAAAAAARKRFRTKFSPEQKQRMQALSERLGWRLQKRDEAVVDECCREIGVTKGVFKVWMHNNKHNFVAGHSARRSASTAAATTTHPSSQSDAAAVHRSAPAAAASAHTSVPAAAPAPAPPPPAPVHSDFNINTTAADYFRVQPSTASVGSPQSS